MKSFADPKKTPTVRERFFIDAVHGGLVHWSDWEWLLETLFEGDEGLCRIYSVDSLDKVVQGVHELLVVAYVEFDEHGIRAGGAVAFHYLRYLLEFFDDALVHGASLELYSYVCAGGVAETLGAYLVAGTDDYAVVDESLHALMDGSAGHIALCGYVLEWNTGVDGDDFQYLLIEFVNHIVHLFKSELCLDLVGYVCGKCLADVRDSCSDVHDVHEATCCADFLHCVADLL